MLPLRIADSASRTRATEAEAVLREAPAGMTTPVGRLLLGLLLLEFRRRPTWTLVTAADATNPLRSWPRVLALMIAGLLASRAGLIERIAVGPAPAGLPVPGLPALPAPVRP